MEEYQYEVVCQYCGALNLIKRTEDLETLQEKEVKIISRAKRRSKMGAWVITINCVNCGKVLNVPTSLLKYSQYQAKSEFKKVRVKSAFIDKNFKTRKIAANSNITITGDSMKFTARKLLNHLTVLKNKEKYLSRNLPQITEKNLHEIWDIAKELKVTWWYLMDVNLSLENVSSRGFQSSFLHLFLSVEIPNGEIMLELDKPELGIPDFGHPLKL